MTRFLLADTLPPECLRQMELYLGTLEILAADSDEEAPTEVLGVPCDVDLVREGEGESSSLVIVAARPKASWSFGTCFPQLPNGSGAEEDEGSDGEEEANGADAEAGEPAADGEESTDSFDFADYFGARPSLNLRSVTLNKALWLFVWGRQVRAEQVRAHVVTADWFKKWLDVRGEGETPGELFDTLGFDAADLQIDPRDDSDDTDSSTGGLFLWGDVGPAPIELPESELRTDLTRKAMEEIPGLSDLKSFLESAEKAAENLPGVKSVQELLFARARVEHEEGFPHLNVQLPPQSRALGGGDLSFENAGLYLTSPLFASPDGSRVGVQGDFIFSKDKRIHLDLEYPLEGDVIRATGKFLGGPEHLLGDQGSFGFPGQAPELGADDEIELDLEFSKGDESLTLTKMSFSVAMRDKDWTLIPAPVDLTLEGLLFHVTIFEPFGSKMVTAEIVGRATFGDKNDGGWSLVCGGSYPSGQLFLQSETRLELGNLIEKLVGHSEGLDDLMVENLSIDYNYRSKHFALQIDVSSQWKIVRGLVLDGVQFHIQGEESYSGSLSARLTIGKEEADQFHLELSASYDEGWEFEAAIGEGEEIHFETLLEGMKHSFGDFDHVPTLPTPKKPAGAIEEPEVTFKNLRVYGNTATKDFSFKGEVDFEVEGHPVVLEVSIDVKHPEKAPVEKKFSGVLKVGDHEFDVVFAKDEIQLDGSDVSVGNLVASYHSVSGHGPKLSQLAPASWPKKTLDMEMLAAFVAMQKLEGQDPAKRWLFGIKLKAGMDLGAIKLPNLPIVSSALHLPPKVSLTLDLQAVGAMPTAEPFGKEQIESIAALDAVGGLSLPAEGLTAVAIESLVTMNGKVVALELPVGPKPEEGSEPATTAMTGAVAADVVQAAPGSDAAAADSTKWITVQKKIGPIEVERLGLRYENERIWVLFDASLGMGGLTLSLAGLGADSSIDKFDPHFHLSGVGVDYKSPAIEIGGAFLKQRLKDPHPEPGGATEYDAYCGQAVLRTKKIAVSVIGAYAKYHGEPSLFIYGVLDKEMGGIPPFYVTGAAIGFGYNRTAVIPKIEQVHTYPLVTKAIAGPKPLGKQQPGGEKKKAEPPQEGANKLMAELQVLNTFLPPTVGQIFLAIGVKFNSFKLVDSFALLIAQFGEHFQFDLVGVSDLQVPPAKAGDVGTPLARILMNWEAFFHPEEGEMGLRAALAPGSFILSPDCQLTGGFAYYTWFLGEHAGDFVVTVGGYHPDFKKPDHYPPVKRLTFNWILNKGISLHLKGTLYYALCGHALMAGGSLDATMEGGFDIGIAGVHFRAALHIAADFLITWEPYHYDASVSLGLVIEITAHFLFITKHFSLDVGADMHLWGPEFAGEANVHLRVCGISHTMHVTFGAGPPRLIPITWVRFQQAFLPQVKMPELPPAKKTMTEAEKKARKTAADKARKEWQKVAHTDRPAVCGVTVQRGLIRAVKEDHGPRWVVNPKELVLVTNSIVPVKEGRLGDERLVFEGEIPFRPDGEHKIELRQASTRLGIASMGVEAEHLQTTHQIVVRRVKDPEHPEKGAPVDSYFRCEPVLKNMPAALWDVPRFEQPRKKELPKQYLLKPETDGERLLPGVLAGFEIHPAVPAKRSELFPVDRNELKYECETEEDKRYAWNDIPAFVPAPIAGGVAGKQGVGADAVSTLRKSILTELGLGSEEVIYRQTPCGHALDSPLLGKGVAG